jgi:hypothetical protein
MDSSSRILNAASIKLYPAIKIIKNKFQDSIVRIALPGSDAK